MASHFSDIGIDVGRVEDLFDLAERVWDEATPIEVPSGRYLRWRAPGHGDEIWLQVDAAGELVGIVPHFSGRSLVRARLLERVARPDEPPLDGAFLAVAEPDVPGPGDFSCQLVFDCPDSAAHADLQLPCLAAVQLAAFAHEISAHPSEEAFAAWQEAHSLKLAVRSFLPTGLFAPDGESQELPEAQAIVTGIVLDATTRRSALTGAPYQWALVDTLGGVLDVVADPRLLGAPPPVGGVVSGSFWLSGRLRSVRP